MQNDHEIMNVSHDRNMGHIYFDVAHKGKVATCITFDDCLPLHGKVPVNKSVAYRALLQKKLTEIIDRLERQRPWNGNIVMEFVN